MEYFSMKRFIILFLFPFHCAFAQCDPTHFRWDCVMSAQLKPTKTAHSLVYCGDRYLYVTYAQYDQLLRYQRDNINMNLKLNGEYTASPCIPTKR